MAKRKRRRSKSKSKLDRREEKVMRMAHHILTKTIHPAKLTIEEAVDVVIAVMKGLVIANTEDDDLEDRSDMIGWIEERFIGELDAINPLEDMPRAWLVAPQGLITEPIGILWSGQHDENSVQVILGPDLDTIRSNMDEAKEDAGFAIATVTEGVEGLAITDPDWDGKDTIECETPGCGKVHNVHLMIAENLFQLATEHMDQREAAN